MLLIAVGLDAFWPLEPYHRDLFLLLLLRTVWGRVYWRLEETFRVRKRPQAKELLAEGRGRRKGARLVVYLVAWVAVLQRPLLL